MTPVNRWKVALAIVSACALSVIGVMGVRLFDNSLTLGILRDHSARTDNALTVLAASVTDLLRSREAMTREVVAATLRQHVAPSSVRSSSSGVEIDQLRFVFGVDGSLAKVERTNDYGTRDREGTGNQRNLK